MRPVGIGASCGACEDQRRENLRYFELGVRSNARGARWVVLCFNCVVLAERLEPPARSVDSLKMRLNRDRRWGDRRARTMGRASDRDRVAERRLRDRRIGLRDLFDATDLVDELEIEIEADFERVSEEQIQSEEVTGIHVRLDLPTS
jgi:hypothetical protein